MGASERAPLAGLVRRRQPPCHQPDRAPCLLRLAPPLPPPPSPHPNHAPELCVNGDHCVGRLRGRPHGEARRQVAAAARRVVRARGAGPELNQRVEDTRGDLHRMAWWRCRPRAYRAGCKARDRDYRGGGGDPVLRPCAHGAWPVVGASVGASVVEVSLRRSLPIGGCCCGRGAGDQQGRGRDERVGSRARLLSSRTPGPQKVSCAGEEWG